MLERNKKKLFVALIVVTVLAIIGLVVIVVVNNRVDEDKLQEDDPVIVTESVTEAHYINEDILNKLETDENYSLEDAVRDFEVALDDKNGAKVTYLAIYFAEFIYNNYGDAVWAANTMEGVINKVPDDMLDGFEYIMDSYKEKDDNV